MIRRTPAEKRHFADHGWLQTYWLFSFSHYYDPANLHHGKLCVFNDDVVQPHRGFPRHPHDEMEIISIVLNGEMTHEDSMGNRMVIKRDDVQRMSAGTGLSHSEYNEGETPVHFFQIWIYPDKAGITPAYEQKKFDPSSYRNTLLAVASGQGHSGAVSFHTDAAIFRSLLEAGHELQFETGAERKGFLYLFDGTLQVNGLSLMKGDQARIEDEEKITLSTEAGGEFILIDVPEKQRRQ